MLKSIRKDQLCILEIVFRCFGYRKCCLYIQTSLMSQYCLQWSKILEKVGQTFWSEDFNNMEHKWMEKQGAVWWAKLTTEHTQSACYIDFVFYGGTIRPYSKALSGWNGLVFILGLYLISYWIDNYYWYNRLSFGYQ